MAGLFGLSIDEQACGKDEFSSCLFLGIFYHQHWGEERSGMAIFDQGTISKKQKEGLFRPNFEKDMKNGIGGTEAIGCCGKKDEGEQPYFGHSRLGDMALCFSGNIINRKDLISRFEQNGHIFSQGNDTEILASLLAEDKSMADGLANLAREIKGSYSIVGLGSQGVYAICSPDGRWPLVLARKKGVAAVASESSGFRNMGLEFIRELEPGETVLLKNGNFQTISRLPQKNIQICSFYYVYTCYPNAVFKGVSSSRVRWRLGAALAREDIKRGFIPDIVAPVPDSGRHHAMGYYEEFRRQRNSGAINYMPSYNEVLIKYPYAGRSFTATEAGDRKFQAELKILTSSLDYSGQTLVICDDSIVRGSQTRASLIPKLRELNFKEIHLRISNPRLLSFCPWGKSTKREELLAVKCKNEEEMAGFLKVESIRFNKVESLLEAIGLPPDQVCIDCDKKESSDK